MVQVAVNGEGSPPKTGETPLCHSSYTPRVRPRPDPVRPSGNVYTFTGGRDPSPVPLVRILGRPGLGHARHTHSYRTIHIQETHQRDWCTDTCRVSSRGHGRGPVRRGR